MSHLALVLPYGLPPAELAADLLRELDAPALALLVARAKREPVHPIDDFQRALPHEIWLTQTLARAEAGASSPPIAAALMQSLGLQPQPGIWFVLQPVHIHIARDHLVLTDPRRLELQESESRALFSVAEPLFAETGKPLLYGDAGTWFVQADDWAELLTATPDAAGGRNIDLWMPKGKGERDWRKLQNEVQMHWFDHRLNGEREARGLKPVNSIWLWGAQRAGQAASRSEYGTAFNLHGWLRAFGQFVAAEKPAADARAALAAGPQNGLVVVDALLEPALANDWGLWLQLLQALETEWFAPLLAALKDGALDQLSLIASNDAALAYFSASRGSLKKFWIKPSLAPLSR